MSKTPDLEVARRVVARYPTLKDPQIELLPAGGLINTTFQVTRKEDGQQFSLQRLHPVFTAEVNRDIDAISWHLATRGVTTPLLMRTREDEIYVEDEGVWRMATWLPGRSIERLENVAQARSAGNLVGRFHVALADYEHAFHFTRFAHGLGEHRTRLEAALAEHVDHRLRGSADALAGEILAEVDQLGITGFDHLPRRICHGDLKTSNLLFLEDRAYALIDLDTLSHLDLPTEMGDAFRSWCNPEGEDREAPRFDTDLFRAAVSGYAAAARDLLQDEEKKLLVTGSLAVTLELAMRFAADALAEAYFGWDSDRFSSRGDHNLHRARGQLALARSLGSQREEAERLARAAFDGDDDDL